MHLSMPPRGVLLAVVAMAPLATGAGVATASATHGPGTASGPAKHAKHRTTRHRSARAASEPVVHTVELSDETVRLANPVPGQQSVWHTTMRKERWLYDGRSHTVIHRGGETYDQVLGADGVLRNRLPSGEVQTMSAGKGAEGAEIVSAAKTDPVSAYRDELASGDVQDAGLTTYAGRSAHAYQRTTVTTLPDGLGTQTQIQTFYLDPSDGTPFAIRSHLANATGTVDDSTTLQVHEQLPATDANLALVAG
jgi:hypothetical protein